MSNLDLDEQEQLAAVKDWWGRYGGLISTGVTVAALVVAGWQGWRYWQTSQALEASDLYETLAHAVQTSDAKQARDASGVLLEKFPRTTYATLGALTSARFFFDRGDLKGAKAQLQWVIDKTDVNDFRDIARLRLASILIDEKSYEDAIKLLDAKHGEQFDAQFAVLKGDALLANKQAADARTAWKLALDKSDKKDVVFRDGVQMRLDAFGG